jgi:RNA-binding protein YlmH
MKTYVARARGGRVVQTPFLEAEDQETLRSLARQEGLQLEWFGGLPMAERRVGVLYPPEVPQVSDPTQVLVIAFPSDLETLEDKLRGFLIEPGLLGDLEEHNTQYLLAVLPKAARELAGKLEFRLATPADLPQTRDRVRSVVVPSLRVDVVGAKGFAVSRTYFAQGVKAGKVKQAGRTVSAKDEVREGDVLVAEGLGVLTVRKVLGATRKGNIKVELEARR